MSTKKYSFVLPAYKATFLRESVDSILNQTYTDFELIIVNDASPEDLTSIVNSYHDERIQYYVNEKNVGGTDLVAQWNHCITYAKGEYLILASDDDVYHPDYLEKMDVLVGKYPEVNVFRPRVQHMNVDGYIRGESDVLPEFLSHIDFLYARYKGYVSSGLAYYIFRRKELVNIGGFVNFPAAWASDDATVICLSKKGMVSHNDALFAFRTSDLNISSAKNNTKMLLNKMIAIESFFRWFESELKEISVVDKDDIEKLEQILTSLSSSAMLDSMVWLITASDRRAVLSCWFVLCKVKSLSILERIMICGRAYIRIIVREIRDFFKR